MNARFEIVRTDAGWHARFCAANGKIVWVTESYRREGAAIKAIELITGRKVYASPFADYPEVDWVGNIDQPTEIRPVDERLVWGEGS